MFPKIFVDLPVADLARSQAHSGALGWSSDPAFTDEDAACLVISDQISAMLLVQPFSTSFATTEALTAGGSATEDPEDRGSMDGRSIADPDGHLREFFWMDPAATGGAPADA